ncbi:MAG: hypothetical protein M1814_003889 [Vezdaea aestivalis]|nr:MAG: hypothetical protein M1814_003889 [Vezdaea aestivalis]
MDPYTRADFDSLLSLCADADYGGFLELNAGAHCNVEFNPPTLLFHNLVLPQAVRRRMLCRTKCWCAGNPTDLQPDPALDHEVLRTTENWIWRFNTREVVPSSQSGVLAIPIELHRTVYNLDITSPGFTTFRATPSPHSLIPILRYVVHGEVQDSISCRGPPLYRSEITNAGIYPSLADSCRAEVIGGMHHFSLGGHCKRIVDGLPTVFFDDEHSGPGIGWRDPATLYKRLYCFAHCWCDVSRRPWPRSIVPWFHNAQLNDDSNGLVLSFSLAGQRHKYTIVDPVGPREGAGESIGEVATAALESTGLPDSVFPPSNFHPSISQDIKAAFAVLVDEREGKQTCGGSCEGVASGCRERGSQSGCRCAAERVGGGKGFGEFLGICRSLDTKFLSGGRKRSWGDTGGAEVEQACVCNASYVSVACCGADKGGLIWEKSHLKLGRLAY